MNHRIEFLYLSEPDTVKLGIMDAARWVDVARFAAQNKGLIVKLQGVDQREAVELLTGAAVVVSADDLPQPAAGEYYWRDLIGCQVVNLEGYAMGTVTEMMETGSNDVLVVKAGSKDAFGKQERLIPFLYEQVVKRVDLATKTITVDWDAGF